MSQLACRFVASWDEGIPARESFHDAVDAAMHADHEPPEPPEAVIRLAMSLPPASPGLAAVIRLARSRSLPSVYAPAGLSFAEATPVLLDHAGPEVGRVLVVSRDGDRFTALGWVHPDDAEAVRARGHVSPGHWADEASIDEASGVLRITRATCLELSAVADPARSGTVVEVGRPQEVPPHDWEALQTEGSAFLPIVETFRDGPHERLTVAFPASFEVFAE